ncbi:hypothetical protein AQUCO_02900079v1 [Aquilegia coerulea]|uniref:FACT complex subunit n=1 Tax=Aquilegia coerulea TaxID=218851 RepID=A0A2G5D445_AQUCA|nr:hypothetical protein AQUCO_02900079v1 [Aquilegia coerulea]
MADTRNGSVQGGGNAYAIDLGNVTKRLKLFYSHWKETNTYYWGSSDALVVATPPLACDDLRYLKSSALNTWLLGLEFPETIMVFMNKQIHFLCSPKKASVLEFLKKPAKESVSVEIVMHVKVKSDDGTTLMDEIFRSIRAQSKLNGHHTPVVGYIAKEAPEGNLLEIWDEKLKNSNFQLADVTNGFSELFAVKDSAELTNMKKAAYLAASVMTNYVVPRLENIIDEEKKVSHSTLMNDTEKCILAPSRIKLKLKAENVDICYPPIFQSGGEFDLKPTASSNDHSLYYDSTSVIISAIGSRYNSYCANVARSFLINGNAVQSKAYEVLLMAHEAAISQLKPGNKVSAAYQAAMSVTERDAPEFTRNLTKTAGTGIGLEFRESGLSLNTKNDSVLKSGMVFNVSLGFQNLQIQTNNPKTEKFSLLLADTVIVNEKPDVVTKISSKTFKDVAYSVNEDEEEQEKPKPTSKVKSNGTIASFTRTLRSGKQELSKEGQRRQHQAELVHQKNQETAMRLTNGGYGSGDGRGVGRSSRDHIAYRNVNDIPTSRDLMIQIDSKNETVLLPMYGGMVPFHVAMVKSATIQQEGNRTCRIRISFHTPATTLSSSLKTLKIPDAIYLKEVSFRSLDPKHSNEVVQHIKTLLRQIKSRESEKAERATLVTQEKLLIAGTKFKPIRLPDLWIRPSFGGRGRKLTGTLEAHVNGFRYSTSRVEERVDVLYGNIKHAFFQAAEKEMITLLHFHLHNHIMVGRKKTKDVQFYVEVMDVVQTLGGSRRSANDPDEIEEEQRERDRKNRTNMDFQNFVNKVSDLSGQPQFELDLEFDKPIRDLGFHGVPYKASVFMIPTWNNCLVELVENPFLVITLNEVEIVNLERVGLGQKSFDMTIVFKDFKRDVFRIDSIPSTSLDDVKDWLNTTDIKYYESRLNLMWTPILKTIMDDPEKFIEEGGWEFLNVEASDSESENTEDSDQGYEPSDNASDSMSEDEDDDSESVVQSEEDTEEDSEEEEGESWEVLEREATKADREKGDSDSEEEMRERRKKKAFGKSRIPDNKNPRGGPPKRAKFS